MSWPSIDDRVPAECASSGARTAPCRAATSSARLWPSALTSVMPHRLSRPSHAPRRRPLPTPILRPTRRRRAARRCGSRDLMRRAFSALPIAAQMPCPSDPVATSTNGSRGVGCPSRSESDLAQLQQLGAIEGAGLGPGGVQNRRGVALRQDEAIAVRVVRISRVEPHLGEEQRGHDVGHRAAARRMTAAGFGRGAHRIDAEPGGDVLQGGNERSAIMVISVRAILS